MDFAKNNPQSNTLGSGLTDAMVTSAVKASGYPLQLAVANLLSQKFYLEEEWSYPDSDTQTVRTIDIVATRLFEWCEPQPRARPALSFVIECKQSDLPYVFFLSATRPSLKDFPLIAGLKHAEISITTDDDPSSYNFRPISIFDLDDHPFLTTDVPLCMTFSKCVRKGSELVLSGSDVYQGIVFPITKAMHHLRAIRTPPPTAYYFDCELVFGLAVIDAPLVGVCASGDDLKSELVPWVRIVRHHPTPAKHKHDRTQVLGIDIVHKDFLMNYVDEYALPFAEKFAQLAMKHHNVLADARGFVSGMGRERRRDIEPHLEVANLLAKGKRIRATFRKHNA